MTLLLCGCTVQRYRFGRDPVENYNKWYARIEHDIEVRQRAHIDALVRERLR